MEKKVIVKLSIIGLLVLLLLFTSIRSLKSIKRSTPSLKKRQVSGKKTASIPITGEKTELQDELYLRLEEETRNLELIRDPFSIGQAPSGMSSFRGVYLSGIVWDNERPTAIINDNIVGIGAKVGGITVIDIKQNKVVLNDSSGNFELKLGQ